MREAKAKQAAEQAEFERLRAKQASELVDGERARALADAERARARVCLGRLAGVIAVISRRNKIVDAQQKPLMLDQTRIRCVRDLSVSV
jgi:hypothetical protein